MGPSGIRRTARMLALGVALSTGCDHTEYKAHFAKVPERQTLPSHATFLKVHTYSGELLVLEHWNMDDAARRFTGRGIHYDAHRDKLAEGELAVSYDQVALLETNEPEAVESSGVAILGVMTTVSLAITTVCLTVPKACFGSCPTFYANDGHGEALQAEGFSEAVLRAFEKTDVDQLSTAQPEGRKLTLEMRNEALETHAVRSVRVLAVPKPADSTVYRAGDTYWVTRAAHAPTSCTSAAGSCLDATRAADGVEYSSLASADDLATRESIDLEFPPVEGKAGLVIVARNSLLNTFLFYQALSYSGKKTGDWIARLEREAKGRHQVLGFASLLGGIDVDVLDGDAEPVRAGEFFEVGPIARETQLVVLPERDGKPTHVRLSLTQGNWKLDRIALVSLENTAQAVALEPTRVLSKGKVDARAAARLADPEQHLMTYPGDRYQLEFLLPEGPAQLFLESTGYYYEWIRGEWLKEESSLALMRLFADPRGALKRLAPKYKRVEPEMDRVFWQSRVRGIVP